MIMKELDEKIRILVVDDEKIITMHLEELLTTMGYRIIGTAANGEDAISKAEKFKPDLVLMDIIMPGEISGIDAANAIRTKFDIPIIFLSAFVDDKIVEKAKFSEPYGYITKPFQSQELKAAVEITAHKSKMESKAKESEEKYRTVVEGSKDGICIVQEGIIEYLNPALHEMLGKPDDVLGKSFEHYLTDECKGTSIPIITGNIDGYDISQATELELEQADGLLLPVEVNYSKVKYGGKPAIMSLLRNISDRKCTESILDYLVHEINENNQLMIPCIEELISNGVNQHQKNQLKAVLSMLFKNSNTIKKAYKIMQLSNKKCGRSSVDIIDKINQTIRNVKYQSPDRNLQINTHIKGMIPNVLVDEFIDDVLLLIFETSIELAKQDGSLLDAHISNVDIRNKKVVMIRIENRGTGIPDTEKKKLLIQSGLSVTNSKYGFGIPVIINALKKYGGEIKIEDLVEDGETKGFIIIILLPTAT